MELVRHEKLDLSPLITHHFALDDIEEAYELFGNQRDGVVKVALSPNGREAVTASTSPEVTAAGA
jgi:threonine dehydrogenase-like Zn-dependent dehydrogenase